MAVTVGNKGPRQFQDLFDVIPFRDSSAALTATAGSETGVNIAVPGAELGDIVIAGVNADVGDASFTADVTAANVVTVTLANATAGTITIAAGDVKGIVLKPKGNFDIA